VISILCATAIIAAVFAWVLAKPPLYRVTILPSRAGWSIGAGALKDLGQVVCFATNGPEVHLLIWDHKNGMQDLGLFSRSHLIRGLVVGNDGRIAGAVQDPNGWQAFLWEPGKGRTMLGTLGGQTYARAMNNRGQILGVCNTGGAGYAFLWDKTAGMKKLFAYNEGAYPDSINDAGQVIVVSIRQWFLLDPNEGKTSLGEVPGKWKPHSVNNSSCVAAIDESDDRVSRLMLLRGQAKPQYMASINGKVGNATVTRLNDRNQIAWTECRDPGWWQNWKERLFRESPVADNRSYLWDPIRGLVPLGRYTRDMKWFGVKDLNNDGSILGDAGMKDGIVRPVLLEPIPERWPQ
jgi:hypothetical protein